jgi:hypothetical protein
MFISQPHEAVASTLEVVTLWSGHAPRFVQAAEGAVGKFGCSGEARARCFALGSMG